MPNNATASLRVVNAELRDGLARLQPQAIAAGLLTPDGLSVLLKAVSRAAEYRRSLAADAAPDAELKQELREYRSNMEELARLLPTAHGYLLAERARVEAAQSQLAAANAWAVTSKNTL